MGRVQLVAIVALLSATISAGAGWMSRGWLEDSRRYAAQQATQRVEEAFRDMESSVSANVEKALSELRKNRQSFDRQIIREVEKPVYRNVCIGDEGASLLNRLAAGEQYDDESSGDGGADGSTGGLYFQTGAGGADSTKPADKMP